jgi:serine/threonine protein kinase
MCGAMLAGIDLVLKGEQQEQRNRAAEEPVNPVLCPYPDCAQANPHGSTQCIYCDRPLVAKPAPGSLFNLPSALSQRYRITEAMPAKGAEAELLLVQALTGGEQLVAKIYRHGILPKTAVQERIARIDKAHRVDIIEYGVSDGYAYELMEYCTGGSLRTLLDRTENLTNQQVRAITEELALALADIHANGLIHRDLKPENILIRQLQPLDLVLTDFGIASILDVTQRYTGVANTLPYASPESLSGVIDAKADYWALGMIILEASTGRHPFKNLSDAVILHFLTTKNIVTHEIQDPQIGKLVRGLLVRDPNLRWGAKELGRWLAGDMTLTEPQQSPAESEQTYQQPYHLDEQRCYHPEQLGVALAHHWEMGVTDIANGQLLAWFRDVQKDQNVVRILIQLRNKPSTSIDIQLLTLILHLAPGIPPVWRGQSIALSAILAKTSDAIKGDQTAIDWLNDLYQYRVLEIYAKAGNTTAAEIVQRWDKICDQFIPAWESQNTILNSHANQNSNNNAVDMDQLMYGNSRLHRPHLASLHAQILAVCYDSKWAEKKRHLVAAQLTALIVQCPWFVDLGDPETMTLVELLATECLLPEAQKMAEKRSKHEAETKLAQHDEFLSKGKAVTSIISQIRMLTRDNRLSAPICENILKLCADYFHEIAEIRASGRTDVAWQEMRRSALRHERNVHALIEKINRLTEHNAINAGWFSGRAIGYAAAILLFLMLPSRRSLTSIITPGSTTMWIILGIILVFSLWRYLPVFLWRGQIKEIVEKL